MDTDISHLIHQTREACDDFLHTGPSRIVEGELSAASVKLESIMEVVHTFWRTHHFSPEIERGLGKIRQDDSLRSSFIAERYLLVLASRRSLDTLHDAPLSDSVKRLQCEEYSFFTAPAPEWLQTFDLESVYAKAYAGMAVLERLNAGQLHWEMSGIPRSWLVKTPVRDYARIVRAIVGVGGFRPCFFIHVLTPRMRVPVLLEREALKSCLRMAECLVLQPRVRAIIGTGWLYAEETARVSPHLAWMRRFFLENGGVISDIGPLDADAGFLVGSRERQKLFESGQYRPRNATMIWPRKAALAWAARQKT